jgi:hypothetical protein
MAKEVLRQNYKAEFKREAVRLVNGVAGVNYFFR